METVDINLGRLPWWTAYEILDYYIENKIEPMLNANTIHEYLIGSRVLSMHKDHALIMLLKLSHD